MEWERAGNQWEHSVSPDLDQWESWPVCACYYCHRPSVVLAVIWGQTDRSDVGMRTEVHGGLQFEEGEVVVGRPLVVVRVAVDLPHLQSEAGCLPSRVVVMFSQQDLNISTCNQNIFGTSNNFSQIFSPESCLASCLPCSGPQSGPTWWKYFNKKSEKYFRSYYLELRREPPHHTQRELGNTRPACGTPGLDIYLKCFFKEELKGLGDQVWDSWC